MLASAVVNSGVEAPPAAAAAAAPAPAITSEQPPATSSPDSRLPIMWNVAPSSGPQPLVIPSWPACPAAASIKPSSGQSTTQTTTTAHQGKQDTARNAAAAVSSSAVQFDLEGLLSKASRLSARRTRSSAHLSVKATMQEASCSQPLSLALHLQ